MSPSGRETRRTGSYWTTSITTIPSTSSCRCPSFGAFGCPCGSTREVRDPVRDVDAVARRLERRGREDLDARHPGGGTLRGDDADGCAHVRTQRRAVVREELHPDRVRSRGDEERERLEVGDEANDLAIQKCPRMSLARTSDLPGPSGLDHC